MNPEENDTVDLSDELIEHFRFEVDKGQSPLRIDKFISEKLPAVSRNRIQNAAEAGNILVNGKPVKSSYKVRGNDLIRIVLPQPIWEHKAVPEDIPIDIIYEDDEILLVNKKAGMVCHPGHGNYTGTLVNAILFHCKDLPEINGETRPGLVHRIDKNTSGIIIIGKTEHALNHLAKQFYDRTIERNYTALVWGDLKEEQGRIACNIARNPNNRKVFSAVPDGSAGKWAATTYEVIKRYGYVTLVRCKLETGRTHQIRVHMKYIGHTLFNDFTYGGDKILAGTVYSKYKQFIDNCFGIMPYHALHAQTLGFVHPRTHEKMFFEVPLPANFQQLLEKWESYTKGFNL